MILCPTVGHLQGKSETVKVRLQSTLLRRAGDMRTRKVSVVHELATAVPRRDFRDLGQEV